MTLYLILDFNHSVKHVSLTFILFIHTFSPDIFPAIEMKWMRSYRTLSMQDVYIICVCACVSECVYYEYVYVRLLHGAANLMPYILLTLFRMLEQSFKLVCVFSTVWYVWSAITCTDFVSLQHCMYSLYVQCQWVQRTSQYNREKLNFFSSLLSCGKKSKIHMSCLLYFVVSFYSSEFLFFCSLSTSLPFFWHIEQVKRVPIVVDILRISPCSSYFHIRHSHRTSVHFTWKNLQEFEIISALLSTFFFFLFQFYPESVTLIHRICQIHGCTC